MMANDKICTDIQSTFARLFSDIEDDDEVAKTLIISIVNALHFFVLVVEFNFHAGIVFAF